MSDLDLVLYLDSKLNTGLWLTSSFRVCYFKPFPTDFYPEILANLPSDKFYTPLPHEDAVRLDGTSTRTVVSLDKIPSLFWQALNIAFCSPALEEVLRKYLAFEGRVKPVARLFRDFTGYKINPHPDSSKKAATIQFYLPSDDSQTELGTSIYYKNSDGSFTETVKLPFLPNSAYAFKVTEKSWHGTNLPSFSKPRDSLILTYYKDNK